jgi:16S rRNA (cytidine1402-2'-O)-methyltransferase
MKHSESGTLVLAAAPIGNPADASGRLAAALAGAQVIAAEDTRRVRRLAASLGVRLSGRVVSYYDAVERSRVAGLLGALRDGKDVLLITDAGTPAISDPGFRLVTAAAADGVPVTVLPGPSAVTAALAVSGLPSDRFCFEGFPPRRPGERARRFAGLAGEPRTMIFFESPRRVSATLDGLAAAFGADRRATVCRELTKPHQEIRRGTLADLAEWAAGGVLGEITLVVAGAPAGGRGATPGEAAALVADREAAGTPRKTAIAEVSKELNLAKREVYDAVLRRIATTPTRSLGQRATVRGGRAPEPGRQGERPGRPGRPDGRD